MSRIIFSMSVSLDGFIADRNGEIDWTEPDEELHRFHNERVRELGLHFLGRRLYEEMSYWETPARVAPSADDVEREFAGIWRELPKVVFSRTLETVEGSNTSLAKGDVADEVAGLKDQSGKDVGVGGADLAASFIELGLIDDFQLFVYPIALGAGKSFFPSLDERIELDLVERREFGSRVQYLHYRRV